MKKTFILTLLFFGLFGLALPWGAVIPVSAASRGNHGLQNGLSAPVVASVSIPGRNSGTSTLFASRSARVNSYMILVTPADIGVGDSFTLSGYIRNISGSPVEGAHIIFSINGEYLGQTVSALNGFFTRTFASKNRATGTYAITAVFNGTHLLFGSGASTHLVIYPALVLVQTVPAIPGILFEMEGKQYLSGPDGSVGIPVSDPGDYRLTILADQYNNPAQKIKFSRWLDGTVQPYLDITVPAKKKIQVGLNVFHQVSLAFVDQARFPVDPLRVTQVTYRSAQGDVFVVNNGDSRWIPSSRISRVGFGLVPTPLLYSVIAVMADGSNVVNSSQQKFYALPNDTWQISMLLYSIRFSATDGLFNFPAGNSINLVAPDGSVKNYPLGLTGTAEIHSLARGNYSVVLVGGHGLTTRTPIALSRNQSVSVKNISYLDLAVVGVLGIVLTLGLLLYGRPQIFSFLVRKNQPQVAAIERAVVESGGKNGFQMKRKGVRPNNEFIKWS